MCVCVCVCVCTCAKALPRPFSDQPLPRAPTSRRCVSFCDKEVESDGGNGEIALFQSEGKSEGKAKNTAVARAAAHRVVVTRLPSRIIVCDDCEYIPVGTRAVQGEQKHAHPIPVSTCLLCAVCALFLYVCLNHSLTHCLSLSLSHSLTHSVCLSLFPPITVLVPLLRVPSCTWERTLTIHATRAGKHLCLCHATAAKAHATKAAKSRAKERVAERGAKKVICKQNHTATEADRHRDAHTMSEKEQRR